jgi:hypothetical protein
MRRSWIALLVVATVTAIACAHPHEDPLPGEPTTSESSQRPTSTATNGGGGDETATVCTQAIDRSQEVVDQIKTQITAAQANPATAPAVLLTVRSTATRWKQDLQGFANRNIRSDVRDALNQGIDVIDQLLATSPQELATQADQAQQKIQGFLDKLRSACH